METIIINKVRAWNSLTQSYEYFTLGQTFSQEMMDMYNELCSRGAQFERFTGAKDRDGCEVYEGDIVEVMTVRVSSNTSTWYQIKNKHHGPVTLNMLVYWSNRDFSWKLKLLSKEELKRKEAPMGKEKEPQQVHEPHTFDDRDCVERGKVLSNIHEIKLAINNIKAKENLVED